MKYLKLFDLGLDLAWYVTMYHLYDNKAKKVYKAKKSKYKWDKYGRMIRTRDKYSDKTLECWEKIEVILKGKPES